MTPKQPKSNYQDLLDKYKEQVSKALGHLQYSRNKVATLPVKLSDNDEETLETWESFTSRFERVVHLFLTKYIKIRVKIDDPAFDGSLRDYLNLSAKMGLITDVDRWIAMRELRNIQAHDYTDEIFFQFVEALRLESDFILSQIEPLLKSKV